VPQIHIDQAHGLSLAAAQALAHGWVMSARDDFGVQAELAPDSLERRGQSLWSFRRAGAHGTLRTTPERFVLELTLGFLLGSFKDRIEVQLRNNLAEQLDRAAQTPNPS
jgi:hypothetical protein